MRRNRVLGLREEAFKGKGVIKSQMETVTVQVSLKFVGDGTNIRDSHPPSMFWTGKVKWERSGAV